MSADRIVQIQRTKRRNLRRGAALVLMAIFLAVAVLLAAFAINLAYVQLSRTEMYISADAAIRAGGREFTVTGNRASAMAKSRDLAARNLVAGQPLLLADSDFVFGRSTRNAVNARYDFIAGGSNPNSLELLARRTDGSASGAIPLLMPNILGVGKIEA